MAFELLCFSLMAGFGCYFVIMSWRAVVAIWLVDDERDRVMRSLRRP